ncbi:hypothetical protein P8452_78167 [Trifolium repens]|nr:hypothetical protein P8452_78167 [Trifolium repens]
MKDVASVMVNSRINKQVRKAIDYNIEKLSSYADLIVHNDKNLDLDAPIVDDLVEVGEASGGANGLRNIPNGN